MFQLTAQEVSALRSQIATTSGGLPMKSQDGLHCEPNSLALGERENLPPRLRQARTPGLVEEQDAVFPLPAGEGQGEGERDGATQNGRTNFASSTRPFPGARGLCHPKTNVPTRYKKDGRKQASALLFRALLPTPALSPLVPRGERETRKRRLLPVPLSPILRTPL